MSLLNNHSLYIHNELNRIQEVINHNNLYKQIDKELKLIKEEKVNLQKQLMNVKSLILILDELKINNDINKIISD